MPAMTSRAIAYVAFLLFCVLSSIRDVLSEIVFKHPAYEASPVFVLFVYSAVTQIVAGAIFLVNRTTSSQDAILIRGAKKEIVMLNIFTLLAFLLYFLAIQSQIGAAINAFIDYGSGPIFTAMVAAVLVAEPLTRRFAVSAALSIAGLAILELRRGYAEEFSSVSLVGTSAAVLSAVAGAIYHGYFKVLLERGLTAAEIILFRLVATTGVLGIILLIDPDLFRYDLLLGTVVVGFVGFTVPLFLTLTVMRRVPLQNFAVLLFLVPVLTLFVSASVGYATVYITDILAAALLLVAITLYER